ncbi:acyl carrier protein [Frankia sp. B2]|nr:acyl carrier protein [Frankia sp. B2]
MSWDVSFDMLLRARLPFLGPDEVLSPDADLVDLGLDSMAMVELLTALEETYDVTMPEETLNIATFRTPASVWSALCSALGVTGGPC